MKKMVFVTFISMTIAHYTFAAPPLEDWNRFKGVYGDHLTVEWDRVREAPSSINGAIDAKGIAEDLQVALPILDPANAEQIVERFLAQHEGLFQLKSLQLRLHPTPSWSSPIFNRFYLIEYHQVVINVPIEGTRAWVAIDENARIVRVGFQLHPNINLVTVPLINEVEVVKKAKAEFGTFVGDDRSEHAHLSILPPGFLLSNQSVINTSTLVWNVFLAARVNNLPVHRHIMIDANSGWVWANDEIKDEFSATVSGNMNLHYLWDIPGTPTHTNVSISGVSAYVDVRQLPSGPTMAWGYTDSSGNYSLSWNAINGTQYELYFSMYLAPNGTHVYLKHPFTASSASPNLVYYLGKSTEDYQKDLSSTAWQADQMRLFFTILGTAPSAVEIEINEPLLAPPLDKSQYIGGKIILAPDTIE